MPAPSRPRRKPPADPATSSPASSATSSPSSSIASPAASQAIPAEGAPTAPGTQQSTAAEGPARVSGALGLSAAVDVDAGLPLAAGTLAPSPGDLPDIVPTIPAELDAALNGRERRTVWHMVAGLDYHDALDACGVPKRAAVRDSGCPPHVRAAVYAVLRDVAYAAGLNRRWIVQNTVALYRRASQAEEVLDRKGVPTGVFKFDGATASKCLDMLAEWEGTLKPRKGSGIAPSDVAELMAAIAARGRQPLARPEPRLVGSSSAPAAGFAATQQREKPE